MLDSALSVMSVFDANWIFTSEEAAKRPDGLREKIRQLRIRHEGKMLDGITLSMGIAAYPDRLGRRGIAATGGFSPLPIEIRRA